MMTQSRADSTLQGNRFGRFFETTRDLDMKICAFGSTRGSMKHFLRLLKNAGVIDLEKETLKQLSEAASKLNASDNQEKTQSHYYHVYHTNYDDTFYHYLNAHRIKLPTVETSEYDKDTQEDPEFITTETASTVSDQEYQDFLLPALRFDKESLVESFELLLQIKEFLHTLDIQTNAINTIKEIIANLGVLSIEEDDEQADIQLTNIIIQYQNLREYFTECVQSEARKLAHSEAKIKAEQSLVKMKHTFENQFNESVEKFKQLLKQVTITKSYHIIFTTPVDIFFLMLINKLSPKLDSHTILFSDETLETIKYYINAFNKNGDRTIHSSTFKNFVYSIKEEALSREYASTMIENNFLNKVKLLDVSIDHENQKLFIFSHRSYFNFNLIKEYADYFKVTYQDDSLQEIVQTVTKINEKFSYHLFSGTLNLDDPIFNTEFTAKMDRLNSEKLFSAQQSLHTHDDKKNYSVFYVFGYHSENNPIPAELQEKVQVITSDVTHNCFYKDGAIVHSSPEHEGKARSTKPYA